MLRVAAGKISVAMVTFSLLFALLFLFPLILQPEAEGCAPPPPGMVSWWSGDNNALDMVGTNNGTPMNGATYAAGVVGQAFSFDGVNDYVSLADVDFRSNTAGSMAFWVKTSDAAAPTTFGIKGAFFGRGNKTTQHLHFGVANGKQTAEWYDGGDYSIQGASNIADGAWHHLVFVSDGAGTISLYADGLLENAGAFLHTAPSFSTRFGGQYEGHDALYAYYYNGLIDEVQVYNRALTAPEIAAIAAAGSGGICRTALRRTGQTAVFAGGDDGDLRRGLPWPTNRFLDPGDGTLHDNLTGLIWLKDGGCLASRPWSEAVAAANGLSNGTCGLTDGSVAGDWRLPNVNELDSLVNVSASDVAAWLNGAGFANIAWYWYWTSSTYMPTGVHKWGVVMQRGSVSGDSPGNNHWILPVRGTSKSPGMVWKTGQTTSSVTGDDGDLQKGVPWPETRFIVNGDDTATDGLTGLIWSRDGNAPGPVECTPGTLKTWTDAIAYIGCLNTNGYLGYTDWRLPNRTELQSLYNYGVANPATWLNTQGFRNVQNHVTDQLFSWYWTSSTYAPLDQAWWVDLGGSLMGDLYIAAKTSELSVWPVRGGIDSYPDSFSFDPQTGAALSSNVTSNTIIVSGINLPTAISVTGGQYSIGCTGTFVGTDGIASNGDTVCVRQTTSSIYSTTTKATLIIGGVSADFNVTTMAIPTYTITYSAPGGHGTVVCDSPVSEGSDSVCTMTPDTGYYLSMLSVAGIGPVSSGIVCGAAYCSYTITNVTAAYTLQATFSESPVKRTSTSGDDYFLEPDAAYRYLPLADSEIRILAGEYVTVTCDQEISVAFRGGYTSGFSESGRTLSTIAFPMTISAGTVTVDNVEVK